MRDTKLLAAEAELYDLLPELDLLQRGWPSGRTATVRAGIGNRVEAIHDRIGEIYAVITETRAQTPAGAAVKLRRALANLEDHSLESRLVAGALEAVDGDTTP